jgi:hypothetical protein
LPPGPDPVHFFAENFDVAYENDFQCIYVYNIFVTDSSVKKKWLEPHLGPFIQQKDLFLNLPSNSPNTLQQWLSVFTAW